MSQSLRLAELLCARLCHELSSPLGTLAGVMEMMTDGGATAAEARRIADEAAVAVRLRLRLLRAAWTGDCAPMDAAELRGLSEGLRAGRRVRVDLSGLQGAFSGQESRMLLNLLLLGVESLAGNGTLTVAGSAEDGIVVSLDGPRAAWPETFTVGLADSALAWDRIDDSRTLQGALVAILAHDGGVRLVTEDAVEDRPAPLRLMAA